jgi:hypothetical protein
MKESATGIARRKRFSLRIAAAGPYIRPIVHAS